MAGDIVYGGIAVPDIFQCSGCAGRRGFIRESGAAAEIVAERFEERRYNAALRPDAVAVIDREIGKLFRVDENAGLIIDTVDAGKETARCFCNAVVEVIILKLVQISGVAADKRIVAPAGIRLLISNRIAVGNVDRFCGEAGEILPVCKEPCLKSQTEHRSHQYGQQPVPSAFVHRIPPAFSESFSVYLRRPAYRLCASIRQLHSGPAYSFVIRPHPARQIITSITNESEPFDHTPNHCSTKQKKVQLIFDKMKVCTKVRGHICLLSRKNGVRTGSAAPLRASRACRKKFQKQPARPFPAVLK